MKTTLLLTALLAALFLPPREACAQEGVVTYAYRINGHAARQGQPLHMSIRDGLVQWRGGGNGHSYLDYRQHLLLRSVVDNGVTYTLSIPFDSLPRASLTGERDTLLGIPCRKANLVVRSNHIEVWYAEGLGLRGSPSPEIAPYLGLVLRLVRNGNFEIYATQVDSSAVPDSLWESPLRGRPVDEADYQAILIGQRYTTVPVFTRQQIHFGDSLPNPPGRQAGQVYRYAGGTVVLKKIRLPEGFHGSLFAALTQYSNGDAYDRTGCVFALPAGDSLSLLDAMEGGLDRVPVFRGRDGARYQGMVAVPGYSPPLELMRFFTPFGVGAYNGRVKIRGYPWADSARFVQDISDLLPLLSGEVWIGVYIGNYDRQGHTVSLSLRCYPGGGDSARRWARPLFNTVNILEMAGQNYGRLFGSDSLRVRVFIPDSVEHLRLRYISTGHGGWGGGDEFTPRENTLLADGKKIFAFTPWRSDCGSYRLLNPSSGNFGNGLSSSDYSRSGWCPGTSTNPWYIPLDLAPGWHTLTVAIPQGPPEGSSFSFWNVSGCLVGTIKPRP